MASSPHYYNTSGQLVHPLTPGAYVSPTTVLSIRHNEGLATWRQRVGTQAARIASLTATTRGTYVHHYIEGVLRREIVLLDGQPYRELYHWDLLNGFVKWADKYKPETVAIEAFCKSDTYKFAGRVDYICKIDGQLTIVDWKTSKKIHPHYELQLAAYRHAWHEMTGDWAETRVVQLTDSIARNYREKTVNGDIDIFLAHKRVYDYSVAIGETTFTENNEGHIDVSNL